MPHIQDVVDYIFSIAPNPSWAEENIYEFGSGRDDLTGIGVAWWIDSAMLEDFAAKSLNLGITHERVIYDVPRQYCWGTPCRTDDLEANQRIARLVQEHHIAIHRFHSNLDLVDWGMPRALIDRLGWSSYPSDWSRGVPVVTVPETTLGQLMNDIKKRLKLPFLRYDGDLSRPVRQIGLAWGGLCQWWTAAACVAPLGVDVIVGGDIIDGVVRLCREQGWCIVDAMHHATELPAMQILTRKLRTRFPGVPVHMYENTAPWQVA